MLDENTPKLEEQLCFPLYVAAKSVINAYAPLLDKLGLTYTQYLVMLVLWEVGSATVKTIGEKLFLDSGTLSPLLKTMERKGLIRRERSLTDERCITITPTKKGDAIKKSAADIPNVLCKTMPLSIDEASTLYQLLYKLIRT